MIKIDGNSTELEGNGADILSECVALLSSVIKETHNITGEDESKILDIILEGYNISKLLESGMSYEESVEILGITKVN